MATQRELLGEPHAQWLDVDRDDCVAVLAAGRLLTAARSGDVCGADGRPLPVGEVADWAKEALRSGDWPLIRALFRDGGDEEARRGGKAARPADDDLSATPPSSSPSPAPPERNAEHEPVLQTLRRLGVASLERLVREVSAAGASITRTAVLAALARAPRVVRFIGRSIVAYREDS
jgi:hypothetical protein